MFSLILFDKVHELFQDNNPAIQIPIENWSPTPQALIQIPEDLAPYVKPGMGWVNDWFNLDDVRDSVISDHKALFLDAFTRFDARAQRPSTTVLSALMYDAPIPEPDADFIWQLEAIKEENRALLAKLEAAQTWEEAVEITPWIPWEAPNPASRQHSRATQNLSGTDNVHLPS